MADGFNVMYFNQRGNVVTKKIPRSRPFDREIGDILCNGQCHALAIALHEILGWKIFGEYWWETDDRRTRHFVLQTPSKMNDAIGRESWWMVDLFGMRCLDCGYRPTTPEAIRRETAKGKWLPLAMDFARHYAPLVATELRAQFDAWIVGDPRPEWTLYLDPIDYKETTGKA